MPKPKYNYTIFSIKRLLEDVLSKANIKILTIADCEILSAILLNEKIILSKDTIARLYKIIPTKSIPYKNTLDKLCTYIGYNNWDNFYIQFRKENDENTVLNDIKTDIIKDNELLLLKYCIEDNAFNPVINYLNKISETLEDPISSASYKIANLLGYSIRQNKLAQKTLIPVITKNEVFREMFYTWWVDMDGLDSYYAHYIKQTYLKHIHPNDRDYMLNEIWAYSMLMYNALYAENLKKFAKYAYVLFHKYNAEEIILSGRINFYPFARFHSNHIIYHSLLKNASSSWFENKLLFIKNELQKTEKQFQIVIVSHIVEAFVIAGKHELAMAFFDDYKLFLQKYVINIKINTEQDSLIKMIFYFHLVFEKLNILEKNLSESVSFLIEKPAISGDNFLHSYNYYLNSVKQFYAIDALEKDNFINKASRNAAIINNKYFLNLQK